jgi:hypothetical protein
VTLDELEAAVKAMTKGPWAREPLTYWDDRGEQKNHNWNNIGGADTAEGYDHGSFGSDKTKPWGGATRTEPTYIALPDAVGIALLRNCAEALIAVSRSYERSREHLFEPPLMHGETSHREWLKDELCLILAPVDQAIAALHAALGEVK